MRFDCSAPARKAMKSGLENERPFWSYEDIGVFSLILAALRPILEVFVRLHLLPRSQLEHPGFGLEFVVVVFLMLALCLVLKARYHRPVLRALGWLWPRSTDVIIAAFLGVLLATAVIFLGGHAQNTPTMPLLEVLVLGVVLGPILEESFFRGCLLPVLARGLGDRLAVILTALLFALFHSPANLAHWVSFTGSGLAYGWIRVTSRSTVAATIAHAIYNLALFLFTRF